MPRVGGACLRAQLTVDAEQYLPPPMVGHVMFQMWDSDPHCASGEPIFFVMPTACIKLDPQSGTDAEVLCDESTAGRYTAFSLSVYTSSDITCGGDVAGRFPVQGPSTCSRTPDDEDPSGWKSVWCGAGCRLWKTFRSLHPKCDAADEGTPFAINLDKEFGPECTSSLAQVAPGMCCYAPLGYDGGLPFGTDCGRACLRAGRYGASNEWCQKSNGDHYGNCFWYARHARGGSRPCAAPTDHPALRAPRAMSAVAPRSCTRRASIRVRTRSRSPPRERAPRVTSRYLVRPRVRVREVGTATGRMLVRCGWQRLARRGWCGMAAAFARLERAAPAMRKT